jgi:hypothetical protein
VSVPLIERVLSNERDAERERERERVKERNKASLDGEKGRVAFRVKEFFLNRDSDMFHRQNQN